MAVIEKKERYHTLTIGNDIKIDGVAIKGSEWSDVKIEKSHGDDRLHRVTFTLECFLSD